MPTLRALECLVAVVDAGSVTGAAAALHASQPAVSHQLAALEQEIGVTLLERLPRGVRPTVAGRAVLDHARTALDAADQSVRAGRAAGAAGAGVLRIGCAQSLTATLLPPVLRTWRRRYPDVELQLTEGVSADELARAVTEQTLDVAVCPEPTTWAGRSTPIGREQVVVAMPVGHPLDRPGRGVRAEELVGVAAVHHHPDNALAAWIDGALAERGVQLSVEVRTRQAYAAAQLAAAGLGIAVVPTSALAPGFAGALRPLDPPLSRDVVALTSGASDAVVQRFVADLVRRGVPLSAGLRTRLGMESPSTGRLH